MFGKENITNKTIEHSSIGEYTKTNRLKSGGHGQECIDYMNKNNIEYNITKIYKNGVRVGNVPNHLNKIKRDGGNQSWFPCDWKRDDIKSAGKSVAKGRKYPDGKVKSGKHKNVDVGIIRTKGEVSTIFPLNKQKSKRSTK